jgi:hypothetical protein
MVRSPGKVDHRRALRKKEVHAMTSSAAPRHTLSNSMHHLPAGSVAKQRTNPNRWIELTLGVRRRKELPDLSAPEGKRPAERTYMTRQ